MRRKCKTSEVSRWLEGQTPARADLDTRIREAAEEVAAQESDIDTRIRRIIDKIELERDLRQALELQLKRTRDQLGMTLERELALERELRDLRAQKLLD